MTSMMAFSAMHDVSPHVATEVAAGNNYNLYTDVVTTKALLPAHIIGGAWVTAFVRSGISLGATSTAADSFDVGAFTSGMHKIIISNAGTIDGYGGAGGAGGISGAGTGGSIGGDAILTAVVIDIDNLSGIIRGGGGGGGGGGLGQYEEKGCNDLHGGAGGIGQGSQGAAVGGAAGGSGGGQSGGTGGSGGSVGTSGASGGSGTTDPACSASGGGGSGPSGNYINGNSKTTWLEEGTRGGTVTG